MCSFIIIHVQAMTTVLVVDTAIQQKGAKLRAYIKDPVSTCPLEKEGKRPTVWKCAEHKQTSWCILLSE